MIDSTLLDRLRKADPATYAAFDETELFSYKEHDDYGSIERYAYQEDVIDAVKEAWLQHVLQDAIQAKGYMFSVSHIWPNASLPAYQWKARIFIDPDNIIERRSDLPARALLSAYIAACEAMT